MSLLDQDSLLSLSADAIQAGLRNSRDALLVGLGEPFVANLPKCSKPAEQIRSDLDVVNAFERLDDGTVPLLIWLRNAEQLAGLRPQSATFAAQAREIEKLLGTAGTRPSLPAPPVPPLAAGFLRGAFDVLVSALLRPERWSALVAASSPALPADFSLSHLALRPRRRDDPVDGLRDRCLAGVCLPLIVAIVVPLLVSPWQGERLDRMLYLRHLLCVTALAVSAGAGMSVGSSVASGIAASTAGVLVGVMGVTLDMLLGHERAQLGIGAAGGASLGAAALVSRAVGLPALVRRRGLPAVAAVIPTAFGVAVLCVLGFALSQLPPLDRWYQDPSTNAGPLFAVGALVGTALGVPISWKGWTRLRVLPSLDDRLSPLVAWLGTPLVAGALLTWLTAGRDDRSPDHGLAIGVLTGAVIAAAFAMTYAVLTKVMDSMRAAAWSAVGVAGTAQLLLRALHTFRHLTDPLIIANGILVGFALAAAVVAAAHAAHRRTERAPPAPG